MSESSDLHDELRDRLADQALREVLSGRRPPDLSAAILAAAAEPVVNDDSPAPLAEGLTTPVRLDAPRRPRWRTRLLYALAACLLVAIGFGAGALTVQQLVARSADGSEADIDSLISLITSTITPDSWEEVDGAADGPESDTRLREIALSADSYHDANQLLPDDPYAASVKETRKAASKFSQVDGIPTSIYEAPNGGTSSEREARHRVVVDMLAEVERSHVPVTDEPPLMYPDAEVWQALNERSRRYNQADGGQTPSREKGRAVGTVAPGQFSADIDLPFRQDSDGDGQPSDLWVETGHPDSGSESHDTDSLMLQVTPRVVLQEEEEALLGIVNDPAKADVTSTKGYPVADLVLPIPGEAKNEKLAQLLLSKFDKTTLAALAEKTVIEALEKPLTDVIEDLKQRHHVEIQIERKMLEDAGVTSDTPVTWNLHEVSLASALKLVLSELELDFIVEGNVISITSPAKAAVWRRQVAAARADQGRGPGESGDRYARIVENQFLAVLDNPLSTFSIDVDTASYAKARRYITQEGTLPPPDAVRIEEFVNYFEYDYAPPADDAPFAAHVEVAACPWRPEHRLVRVGLKGREVAAERRPTSNLVFLLDVSGSMEPEDKLPRVRRAMRLLVDQLGENDRVAIVVYASAEGLVLPSTPGAQRDTIQAALEQLQAGGSTNGGAGIRLAYDVAAQNFITGGVNRVVLCTDGDFNVGTTSDADLERLIEERAKAGVFLTVLGFGMGNHNDAMLEKLADKGNGNYGYIDTEEEARKLLVDQLSGTLVTIAKDVKLQLEFNPAQVAAWRLIGYEDRVLAAEDFRDDRKDAGEIGAGHTVTALYEVVPAGRPAETQAIDPLKYQRSNALTDAAASGELLTLKVRYKQPDGQVSTQPLDFPVKDAGQGFGQASGDFKFAAAVAGCGMLLRGSQYKGNLTYDAILEIAQESIGADPHGYRAGFLDLVRKAKELTSAER